MDINMMAKCTNYNTINHNTRKIISHYKNKQLENQQKK